MQDMFPGKVNSPQTELAQAIDDEQTTIPLLDASVLPDPPNLATIGTGENAETVLYEGIDGNDLIDVTRGFQGTAQSWSAGVKVARLFTAYDHDAFIENINSHASRHATGGADPLTPEDIGAIPISAATSAATPNTIVQRDPAGRFKAGAPSEADDVARKAEVDAIESDYQLSRKFRTISLANEKRKLLSIALGTYQNIVFKLTVTMTEPTFFAFWEGLIEVRRETGDVTYEVREYTENKINNNVSTTMILKFYVDQSTRSAFVYIERGAWGAQGTNVQVAYQILGGINQPTIVFENELVTDYQGTEVTVITR